MSCSEARRARRLARKQPPAPDYILEPVTPDEWKAETKGYITYYLDELESDQPIIRERIEKLIQACPHEDVKAWAWQRWQRARTRGDGHG